MMKFVLWSNTRYFVFATIVLFCFVRFFSGANVFGGNKLSVGILGCLMPTVVRLFV
jgi:hypothetical protein